MDDQNPTEMSSENRAHTSSTLGEKTSATGIEKPSIDDTLPSINKNMGRKSAFTRQAPRVEHVSLIYLCQIRLLIFLIFKKKDTQMWTRNFI